MKKYLWGYTSVYNPPIHKRKITGKFTVIWENSSWYYVKTNGHHDLIRVPKERVVKSEEQFEVGKHYYILTEEPSHRIKLYLEVIAAQDYYMRTKKEFNGILKAIESEKADIQRFLQRIKESEEKIKRFQADYEKKKEYEQSAKEELSIAMAVYEQNGGSIHDKHIWYRDEM